MGDRADHRRATDADGLVRTLRRLYPAHPLLETATGTHPVWVAPAPSETRLDDVLTSLDDAPAPGPETWPDDLDPAARSRFDRLLEASRQGRGWNGVTFSMTTAHLTAGSHRIDCRLGRYFLALATCDGLEIELLDAQARTPDAVVDLAGLPMRRWLHERVGPEGAVNGGRHRSAAIAVSCVTVYRDGPTWRLIARPRSSTVGTHPGRLHVAPAFMHQPVGDDPHADLAISTGVRREYLEELFGHDEGADPRGDAPPLRSLDAMIRRGDAELRYTGVTVNLMNLRPEICCLLLLRDPSWAGSLPHDGSGLSLNDEFTSGKGGLTIADGRVVPELARGLALDEAFAPVSPGVLTTVTTTPPALGAVALALDSLRP